MNIAHVGRDIPHAVHAWQIVMAECSNGATELVELQARGVGALHRKLQQLRLFEDS